MASKLDKVLKLLESLEDEDKKVVKEALPVEEEVEETEKVEETKEEVKEEKQETPSYVTKDELERTIKSLLENVSTKGELDEVKKEVTTTKKKAQPFGAESKVDNTKEDNPLPGLEEIQRLVNSNFR